MSFFQFLRNDFNLRWFANSKSLRRCPIPRQQTLDVTAASRAYNNERKNHELTSKIADEGDEEVEV